MPLNQCWRKAASSRSWNQPSRWYSGFSLGTRPSMRCIRKKGAPSAAASVSRPSSRGTGTALPASACITRYWRTMSQSG